MQESGLTQEGTEGSSTAAGARPRGGTAVRSRPRSDTTVVDLRSGASATGARPASNRRFAPYPGESERDAIVATALAFHQSVPQAPSVLDVDAAALRLPVAKTGYKAEPEACWVPPVLPVEATAAALGPGALADDLDDLDRPASSRLRRSWLVGAAAAGLVALLGGGLTTLLFERQDMAGVGAVSALQLPDAPDPALQPADGIEGYAQAGPPLASVEGLFALEDAGLFVWPAQVEAMPVVSFPAGEQIVMRLDAAYYAEGAQDALAVAWYRGDEELRREPLLLAEVLQRVSYAPALDQPGQYRADVILNEQVVWSAPFEVTAP